MMRLFILIIYMISSLATQLTFSFEQAVVDSVGILSPVEISYLDSQAIRLHQFSDIRFITQVNFTHSDMISIGSDTILLSLILNPVSFTLRSSSNINLPDSIITQLNVMFRDAQQDQDWGALLIYSHDLIAAHFFDVLGVPLLYTSLPIDSICWFDYIGVILILGLILVVYIRRKLV